MLKYQQEYNKLKDIQAELIALLGALEVKDYPSDKLQVLYDNQANFEKAISDILKEAKK